MSLTLPPAGKALPGSPPRHAPEGDSARYAELLREATESILLLNTEGKAHEAQLARMNRLYSALSQVNQSIVWSRDEADLLTRIPEVLVNHGQFSLAWVARPDGETHQVAVISRAGDTTGLLDRIAVRDDDTPEGHGAVGAVLRTGLSVQVPDLQTRPDFALWRAEFLQASLHSLAAFPLRRGGQIWGSLVVYSREPTFFGTAEMALLAEAAMDVSFALDNLDGEAERQRLESRLGEVQKLESLGRLAAGVAHDMNNVLAAVLTLASLHRENLPADDPLAKAFGTMEKACLRGRDLLKSLLGFARRDLESEGPVDLGALIREVVQLLERTTLQRVRFEVEVPDHLGRIQGDGSALSRVLMNLCVNAVDAMPTGGIIRFSVQLAETGGLVLRVGDTGPGMSEEVQRRALEPFFTTKPKGKGTGLGLSMAYGVMQAHGGELVICCRPGKGTVIELTFPASRVLMEAREAPAPEATDHLPERAARILMVDDDPLVREAVTPMLELMGHQVTALASGEAGIQWLEDGHGVDLVLLDMNMPGLTGLQALPRLRGLRPDLPILVASGYRDEAMATTLAPYRKLSSLAKPFTAQVLRGEIQALLRG